MGDAEATRAVSTVVRSDLVEGSELLGRLASLIEVESGDLGRGMTIAAPHHADVESLLAGGHDVNTGVLARLVARELGARCVVASELRGVVDLNKSSFAPSSVDLGHPGEKARQVTDRRLKLFYQSQVFCDLPRIVVEVHGFAGPGGADFQVSCGHTLNRSIHRDALLWAALQTFKDILAGRLRHAEGPLRTASVEVYPLDQVRLRATGTHTFRLLELLRELGFNVAGLHVEIRRPLRPAPAANPEAYQAMAHCLAEAIREFSDALGTERFDAKAHLDLIGGATSAVDPKLLQDEPLVVKLAPRELVGQDVAMVSDRMLAEWALAEDEPVLLLKRPGDKTGTTVRLRGGAAQGKVILLNKALRDRVGVEPGARVHVALRGALPPGTSCTLVCVVRVVNGEGVKASADVSLWSSVATRQSIREFTSATVIAYNGEQRSVPIDRVEVLDVPIGMPVPEFLTPATAHEFRKTDHGVVGLSSALARELGVTFGDIVGVRFQGRVDPAPHEFVGPKS